MFTYDVSYGTLFVYRDGVLVGEARVDGFSDLHRVLDDIIFSNC